MGPQTAEACRFSEMLTTPYFRAITAELPLRLTPGPFEVTPTVLEAAASAHAGHRTPIFRRLSADIIRMWQGAFGIREDYETVILTGTGSAAMEAMMAAAVVGRRSLLLVNGRFSQRLADMAVLHNPDSTILDFGAGQRIEIARVEEALASGAFDAIFFGLQDTRESIINPFEMLCRLASRYGLFIGVDAISAGIVEDFSPSALGVDVFCDSSGKGARSLPGLSAVIGRRAFWQSLRRRQIRSYYLNLAEHYRAQRDAGEPLFAPATALYSALHQALLELEEETVAGRRAAIRQRTDTVRRMVSAEPLRPFEEMPSSITSFLLPPGVVFCEFQQALMRKGVLIYPGSSTVAECFQIGTGGYLPCELLEEALGVVAEQLACTTSGHPMRLT